MRAKASIPAWAKAVLASLGVLIVLALVSSPLWRRPLDQCAALSENIEAVRSGTAGLRVSDAWIRHDRREKFGSSRTVIVGESGDFGGYISQFTLESCLGEGWVKSDVEARRDQWVRNAWVYRKPGWPGVEFLEGIDRGYRTQIVIEASP